MPNILRPSFWNGATLILPLRIFLAVSFIVAGLDKLTDASFFDAASNGYIGAQLQAYAADSPLSGVLTSLAIPNAALFGWMVALGEIAIGLGTLVGLLSRPAAFFGLILSLTFWLTASWSTHPFYFGADLPYAFGWLTLLLAGPHPFLSLDGLLTHKPARVAADAGVLPVADTAAGALGLNRKQFVAVAAATTFSAFTATLVVLRDRHNADEISASNGPASTAIPAPTDAPIPTPAPTYTAAPTTIAPDATATQSAAAPGTTAAPQGTAPVTSGPAAPATTAATKPQGTPLITLDALTPGAAKTFTNPATRQKGIVVRYTDGSVKAFSAVCTHAGCTVGYDGSANQMLCPCHGAVYDGSTGAVLGGPARRSLAAIPVHVDAATKGVYLGA